MRIALTGGPGAGKTALVDALARRGYAVVPEVARRIIAERKARGLSPRPPPPEFARMIFEKDRAQYRAVAAVDGPVFFDRSLLDAMGMLWALGQLPDRDDLLRRYPYHPTAFILPPWRDIYRQDTERDQTYVESVVVFQQLHRWYADCGYPPVEVPRDTVEARCDFILRNLGQPI